MKNISIILLLSLVVLSMLFYGVVLVASDVMFSNDSPFGLRHASFNSASSQILGGWQDLNGLGTRGAGGCSLSIGLLWLLGPVGFAKFYAPLSLLLLGVCAGVFFTCAGLNKYAIILGAIAAELNSLFFSTCCWGIAAPAICAAMTFLCMGLLVTKWRDRWWAHRMAKLALAGIVLGIGVADGADVGALFALWVACFIAFQGIVGEGTGHVRLWRTIGRLAMVSGFALFSAWYSVQGLIETQIKGIRL